jgi:hypothetical protein
MRIVGALRHVGIAVTASTLLISVLLISVTTFLAATARADGAIAVGRCDSYGYASGYASVGSARDRALAKCASHGDHSCQVIVNLSGACGAFAVSGLCGARGWAFAPTRDRAEYLALDYCARYGGHHCRVRMWVCDGG